ncbi:MAG: hypothetical protein IJV36_01320 [Prevotella sp.]|nr:hypothetical protein [Prevotella sp.]
MKKIFTFIVFLTIGIISLSACEDDDDTSRRPLIYGEDTEDDNKSTDDDDIEPSSDYSSQRITKISYLMNTIGSEYSCQGSALYGTTLFQFVNGNSSVYVYDVEKKEQLGTIVTKRNSNWHNNQAAFSHTFFEEGDEFPLLYTSQISPSEQSIQVWRVVRTEELFELQQVQSIKLPYDSDENNLFHFNMVIDDKDEFFWLYSRNRTTSLGQISKWELPNPHAGNLTLTEEDMLSRFPVDLIMSDAQGGTMFGQRIYFVQGVPSRSSLQFHIVNVNTQLVTSFNLRDYNFKVEPEGLSFYRGRFICSTNRRGIYEIYLNAY